MPKTNARSISVETRPHPGSSEDDMAKGQIRSNREKKKPKADKNKKKDAPPAGFNLSRIAESTMVGGGKKSR
jgi:hypothetical protein